MSCPPRPILPDLSTLSDTDKIKAIQNYVMEFQYNYSGRPFLKLNKNGGADHMKLAVHKLIELSFPIQCVEAVFISGYLSADIISVERFPLNFKSVFRGTTHRHMVLAVRHKGRWGAMGLSRRECLMDKRFEYETLTDLIRDFDESYKECMHTLVAVYVGHQLPREFVSKTPICWKAVKIRILSRSYVSIDEEVSLFCETIGITRDVDFGATKS